MKYAVLSFCFSFIRRKRQAIPVLVASIMLFSCTSDSLEDLIPLNPCDTVAITYSGVIQPILEANCYGCHSGNNPRGDVLVDNYEDVRDLAIDGRLGGVVNHEAGYPPMPQMRPQLDTCELYYINTWIELGAPDN